MLTKGHKSGLRRQQWNRIEQNSGFFSSYITDTVDLPHHGSVVCSLFHPSTASTINLLCFLHRSVMQSAANT